MNRLSANKFRITKHVIFVSKERLKLFSTYKLLIRRSSPSNQQRVANNTVEAYFIYYKLNYIAANYLNRTNALTSRSMNLNFFYRISRINKIETIEVTLEIPSDYEFDSRN